MTESLFISDLHLSPERPEAVTLFLRFLRQRAPRAESLYILGDLFDAWVGDDDDTPPYPSVIASLRRLSEIGTRLFFQRGNRDFLVGRRFLRASGCTLLRDPVCIDLYGTPTLLMHGDLLCTDDVAYQRFRRYARNPLLTRLFLLRPLATRRAIAADYRRRSGAATAVKPAEIMDANQRAVEHCLRRGGARQLIHGHTHRPARHELLLDGAPATRWVLAEWHRDRAAVLCADAQGIRVEEVR
jgi:UDP-2,3-diacylglucosamine hydrolase